MHVSLGDPQADEDSDFLVLSGIINNNALYLKLFKVSLFVQVYQLVPVCRPAVAGLVMSL